jgi:CDP-diglyceride synthetase
VRGLADQALRAGHLPLWVNNVFYGFPLLASGDLGLLDPIRLLLTFLTSSARAVSLALPVHVSLGAIFAYILGRRLGLPVPAAEPCSDLLL